MLIFIIGDKGKSYKMYYRVVIDGFFKVVYFEYIYSKVEMIWIFYCNGYVVVFVKELKYEVIIYVSECLLINYLWN